jgi:hypothetical protein
MKQPLIPASKINIPNNFRLSQLIEAKKKLSWLPVPALAPRMMCRQNLFPKLMHL